jgi:hypothetical protein
MGLTDSYPPHPLISAALLEEIEHLCAVGMETEAADASSPSGPWRLSSV